ncbi:MAG: hypothetical protein J6Q83_06380 [Clostridia bacterium]|nr:hypothetical protein [Clostridia bacterium]
MDTLKTGKYPQRVVERYPVEAKVLSLAIGEGVIYLCTDQGLMKLSDDKISTLSSDLIFTSVHICADGRVVAGCESKAYLIGDKGAQLLYDFGEQVADIKDNGSLYVLTGNALYVERDGGFYNLARCEQKGECLALFGERVCVSNSRCLQRMEGKRRTWRCIFPHHSTMPEIEINTIAFDKIGNLLVGAKEGLYIYDYKSGWYSHKEISVLPQESIYSIDVAEDGAILVGTDAGAVLIRNGLSKYFPATRYAYSPLVTNVAFNGNDIYTISEGGIVKISQVEMTLYDKAVHFFENTEKYFPRKDGFITGVHGELKEGSFSSISDNDGLWTQMYLGALCLWYDKTKDEKILKAARRYKDAMLVLTRAPEIKGFTARAVRYPDEETWGQGLETLEINNEWHRSSDGTYEWLGETSSDEMTGHYAGFSLYYDLCANEEEKAEIRQAVCDITDHIMEHNGYLHDWDDKPTTWACWNEDALNNDSMWTWETGINSLEYLTFLKVTHHMSGDEKYLNKYNELIKDHHFLINAAYHKKADGHTCHIDDNLAMFNTLAYLRLEKDPAIRQYIMMGLASHYDYEKIEGNPYFAFIYKGFTGAPCDVDTMVKNLKDHPYELENFFMYNSMRRGLEYDDEPVYWGEKPRIKTPFAWDERPYSKLGLRAFTVDGGRKGHESGLTYLLMYWLGRYFDIIE